MKSGMYILFRINALFHVCNRFAASDSKLKSPL